MSGYWLYLVNASGNSFWPPAALVAIEEDDPERADELAESLGVDFEEQGCPCCGAPWSRNDIEDPDEWSDVRTWRGSDTWKWSVEFAQKIHRRYSGRGYACEAEGYPAVIIRRKSGEVEIAP